VQALRELKLHQNDEVSTNQSSGSLKRRLQHNSQTPQHLLLKNKARDLLPPISNKKKENILVDSDYNNLPINRRYGNLRNDSEAVSRALGFVGMSNRYSVQEIRQPSRMASNERVSLGYCYEPALGGAQSPRGPMPSYLRNAPSLPSILVDSERKSVEYQRDLQRGLQQVYGDRRR